MDTPQVCIEFLPRSRTAQHMEWKRMIQRSCTFKRNTHELAYNDLVAECNVGNPWCLLLEKLTCELDEEVNALQVLLLVKEPLTEKQKLARETALAHVEELRQKLQAHLEAEKSTGPETQSGPSKYQVHVFKEKYNYRYLTLRHLSPQKIQCMGTLPARSNGFRQCLTRGLF